jgi:hypothetical protein
MTRSSLRFTVLGWLLCASSPALGGVEGQNSYLSCKPFAARADGEMACVVRVTVHDGEGQPAAQRRVTLSSSRGAADVVTPATATTDEQGRAEFQVRTTQPGQATLTAQCEGVSIHKGIIDDGAVAIYSFDGTSPEARVRDLSGHKNHGRLVGGPTFVHGRSGDGIQFNGRDQFIGVPHHPSLSGRVGSYVEAWIKTATELSPDRVQVIAQKSLANDGDYRLSLHGAKIAYHYHSSQRDAKQLEEALSDADAVTPGVWTYAAGFWEGSDIDEHVRFHGYARAYTSEGEFRAIPRAQQIEGIWDARVEEAPLFIGASGGGSNGFEGIIDELRVYDRALYDEEMRRNHSGEASVTFGLSSPASFAADDKTLPECVILSWTCEDPHVTTFRIYRSTSAEVETTPQNLLMIVPHERDHFRDYEVDFDKTYSYVITADSFGNESLKSESVKATPHRAPTNERWYRGDGHLHTFNHELDVEDFTPEETLFEARKQGWDFVLVTEHNTLGSYFRDEDQGTADFIVFGTGQEISDGGNHRTGAFLKHYVPTSGQSVEQQNAMALAMGGQVGPNHSRYDEGPANITLFEVVNDRRWFPLDAWDDDYLKRGIHVTAKGGSDAHGRFSIKRGIRWCVWADRLSYRALKEGIQKGHAIAVDGDGLLSMLKVNGAMIGDTLTLPTGTPLHVEVSADSTLENLSEVKLIKFGEVLQTWRPGEKNWKASLEDGTFDGTPTYYRLEVKTEGSREDSRRAVSSAVFVAPDAPGASQLKSE